MAPPRNLSGQAREREPGAARRATLADVAAAANVSTSTASRALTNHPRITEATRQRVRDAAELLGFEPNIQARSLRTNSSMLIGVVVPDIAIAFYASVLKGVQSVLEGAGYQGLVMSEPRCGRSTHVRSTACSWPRRVASCRATCPSCSSTTSSRGRGWATR